MQTSAGILFILNNKALLAHSTNSRWWNSWMPPKGHVEDGESLQQTAARETREEIGWDIDPKHLKESFLVEYMKKNNVWKQIHIFPVYLNSSNDDRVKIVGDLQKEEVDAIEWMDPDMVIKRSNRGYVSHILTAIKK
jgi:8-oxo-dGTP pyrophosphatase MutT (NUDIX family)